MKCAVVLVVAVVARAASAEPTAAEIIDQTNAAYAHAKTYVDHGAQSTGFVTLRHPFTKLLTFDTAFVRDGGFRFEYRDDGDARRAFIIWTDGTTTLSSWYVRPGINTEPSLEYAIAGATGVSGGTAHMIPTLLHGQSSITELTSLAREPNDKLGDHPCYRITGKRRGNKVTLWIDIQTHAIRQVHEENHIVPRDGGAEFDTDVVTRYEPIFDAPVAPTLLAKPDSATTPSAARPSWVGIMFDGHGGTTRIQSVVEGGPAAKAGLHAGDVVTSIGGVATPKASDVIERVRVQKPGTKLRVVVTRDGHDLAFDITIEARPDLGDLQQHFVDHPAPDFKLATLSGPPITKLADLHGHVAIIDFWATWCGPCAYAMPHLVELGHKYKDLRIIGISDEDAADIKAYVKEHGIDYTIARDADDVITGHYLVTGLPTLVIVDKAGVVRALHVGAGDFDVIEAEVQRLLK